MKSIVFHFIRYVFPILGSILPAFTYAQITLDANFENGRLDSAYFSTDAFVLAPITNLHARITSAKNEQPVFKIFDAEGYRLRPYHHMVYRYEGESDWHFFDSAYKQMSVDYYYFFNHAPFINDTVYLAYWYPYTYTDLENYMAKIVGSSYLQEAGAKSSSYEGRNLYGYQITDTNYSDCYKSHVVILARQHPTEHINGYFIEGLTDFLLQDTGQVANFLRRNYHFYIYPMLNPDGVVNGSGQNALGQGLNREWADSLQLGGTPEVDSIRPVIWRETGQDVDWAIDIHANPGSNIPYYWWGYTSSSTVPAWQQTKALAYVQAVAMADKSAPSGNSSYQNHIQGNGASASLTAANWFMRTFQAIAFTFEPTSEPMGPLGDNAYSIQQLKTAGASLAKGFYPVFDTVDALGGSVLVSPNQLIAQVSGGHSPYSYSWIGPTSGNTDTLKAPQAGFYTLTVTDAKGCQWSHTVDVGTNTLKESSKEIPKIQVSPNPTDRILFISSTRIIPHAELVLYDLQGKRIWQSTATINGRYRLSLPSHLHGNFLVHIQGEGIVYHRMITIR